MGIKITGVSTPLGGIQWEYTDSTKQGIEELFYFLESKRILTNPIEMEVKSWCQLSAIEIKNRITTLLTEYNFNSNTVDSLRRTVNACNDFLDDIEKIDEQGIIYKNNNGDWENANFSRAMNQFRKVFRANINLLSKAYEIEFAKNIPEEY